MFDFIRNLQQKSRSYRKKIAFGTAASITVLIAGIWVTTLVGTTGVDNITGTQASAETNSQTASPFVALKESISRAFSEAQNKFKSTARQFSSTTTQSDNVQNTIQPDASPQSDDNATKTTEGIHNRVEIQGTSTATSTSE